MCERDGSKVKIRLKSDDSLSQVSHSILTNSIVERFFPLNDT